MQCPACNSASPDDVRFCLHCGQYLGEPDEVTRVRNRPPPATTIRANFVSPIQTDPISYEAPARRVWPLYAAIGGLAVVALIAVAGLIAATMMQGGEEVRGQRSEVRTISPVPSSTVAMRSPSATPTAKPTPEPLVIFKTDEFQLEPGRFRYTNFVVHDGDSQVVGWFACDGCTMQVFIMDEPAFIEFARSGAKENAEYDSGLVKRGNIDAALSKGMYHLVLRTDSLARVNASANIVLQEK